MQTLYVEPTALTPEIRFSPSENTFMIKGTSSPEDVRAIYYPVIEWTKQYVEEIISAGKNGFSGAGPFTLRIELDYFNSSSAKFFYDIFLEFKKLGNIGIPVVIEWYYEEEDTDSMEAGNDIALLAGMEFKYIPWRKR
ncbi:MAG: DUF1987 domain-containing protein [Bacteroidales bacterium]|nr:DUF1987 domain-containing protein [Bacteroidales bacterium]